MAMAWHPRGRVLATAHGNSRKIELWPTDGLLRNPRPIASFEGHEAQVDSLCFHPGGKLLASGSWDSTTRLWDWGRVRQLLVAPHPAQGFRADGGELFSKVGDSNLGVFEVGMPAVCQSGRLPRVSEIDPGSMRCGFWPRGPLLAVASWKGVHLVDTRTLREVECLPARRAQMALFSAAGDCLFVTGEDGLAAWPIASSTDDAGVALRFGPPRALGAVQPARFLADSADGRMLAVEKGIWVELHRLDLDGSREPLRLRTPGAIEKTLSLHPSGRWLAWSNWMGQGVKVVDLATLKVVGELPGISPRPVFSPDGIWLAVSRDTGCDFYRCGGWEAVQRIPSQRETPYGTKFSFSDSGRLLAIAPSAGRTALVRSETGEVLVRMEEPESIHGKDMALSPDGNHIAVTGHDGSLRIWDVERLRVRLRALGLDWSAQEADGDGPRAAASSKDGPIRITVDLAGVAESIELLTERATALHDRGETAEAVRTLERAVRLPGAGSEEVSLLERLRFLAGRSP